MMPMLRLEWWCRSCKRHQFCDNAGRCQVCGSTDNDCFAHLEHMRSKKDRAEVTLSKKDLELARWCVLTVSKGFTAEHDGQVAACELLARLDKVLGFT